ncbi:MAG: DUF885 domain-containing protein [Acidobacteriota bacterium]|nr:DUF885 domain-containing protein [Acidobacteriota bacterium]
MTRRLLLAALAVLTIGAAPAAREQSRYQDLVRLFEDFAAFERPALKDGAPDYTAATLRRKQEGIGGFNARLAAIDPEGWPVAEQVDHALVGALIDGLDFELRVLRPWERDPAFYKSIWTGQSDTPAHEGPAHHAIIDLWTYDVPLSASDEAKLARELRGVAPLLAQARGNLTGNARDLWITGTGTMAEQVRDLDALATRAAGASSDLTGAIREARDATSGFVTWLEQQAPTKTGPSGIGKEAYTWNLQNVHLVPMTWEDEVALLKRELARAHAALKMEEHRNRKLPSLQPATDAADYRRRAEASAAKYMAWLETEDILSVEPYLAPALNAHLGSFVPLDQRNFFGIASHYEPMTLFAHFYHWFDHEWMRHAPHASAIRRGATLFNVWDSRSEGMATAMEEIILHAGYYDDNPRAREIVWIMLAQRAARGLASLYAQANEFDIAQAKAFQVEWTPRGWMRPDLDLLGFEQQLYLRQPGYGTSYVTGKAMIDELIKTRARQQGDNFSLQGFFDEFNGAGMIPVSLVHHQLTGTPIRR